VRREACEGDYTWVCGSPLSALCCEAKALTLETPFSELAERVQITAEEFAYSTFIYSCLKSPQKEGQGIDGFLSRGVDGLLVSATESPENARVFRELSKANFPIVIFNGLPDLEVDSVVTDNYEGATKAMRHLYELGHREIGFIGPKENSTFQTQRLAGYRDSCTRMAFCL
jgi:LacI family transcriptional regulator